MLKYTNEIILAFLVKLIVKQSWPILTGSLAKEGTNNRHNDEAHSKKKHTEEKQIPYKYHGLAEEDVQKEDSKEAQDPMLWRIHGKEYDLADFVNKHPGGKESILLGRGRDCTALFESYHAFTNQHR